MKFDFSGFLIQMKDSSDATISGLTIIGSLPDDKRAHGGILAHEVRNVSIHDCEVKGLEFTGIWLSQATNSSVHHCRFDDCAHPSKQSCSGASKPAISPIAPFITTSSARTAVPMASRPG